MLSIDGAIILAFNAIISVVAIILVFLILNKVFQEKYKRPWFFIGISTIFLVGSQIIQFLNSFFGYEFISLEATIFFIYVLQFLSISLLAFALLLEYLILTFYKGKFVMMKLIPVQEETVEGDLDLDVVNGNAYLSVKNETKKLTEEFAMGTRKGYEGFLITSNSPRDIRLRYGIQKTPIAYVHSQSDETLDMKNVLDENAEQVDPLQLNKLISYIDNFLEQSQNPFLLIELDEFVKVNDLTIVIEFLQYIANKTTKYNGIVVCSLSQNILKDYQIEKLKEFLTTLTV